MKYIQGIHYLSWQYTYSINILFHCSHFQLDIHPSHVIFAYFIKRLKIEAMSDQKYVSNQWIWNSLSGSDHLSCPLELCFKLISSSVWPVNYLSFYQAKHPCQWT